MSNKRKSRRGEVYDSWINSFGFGTILFFIFVGFWLAAMAGERYVKQKKEQTWGSVR